MRKIINGKIYDTQTANIIGQYDNGYGSGDFKIISEDLYKSTKGSYFLHGRGGPLSAYATQIGNGRGYGEALVPMSKQNALDWCQDRELINSKIEAEFVDLIEEA